MGITLAVEFRPRTGQEPSSRCSLTRVTATSQGFGASDAPNFDDYVITYKVVRASHNWDATLFCLNVIFHVE